MNIPMAFFNEIKKFWLKNKTELLETVKKKRKEKNLKI